MLLILLTSILSNHPFCSGSTIISKSFFLLWLLLFQVTSSLAENIQFGLGEVIISNISPEDAKSKAKQLALIDLLQQVAGIEISSHELIINSSMGAYHLLQTRRARVIDSKCKYELELKNNVFYQRAICTGEVQRFGELSPKMNGQLAALDSNLKCDFPLDFSNNANIDPPFFKANQKFCMFLKAHEDQYAIVFAIYNDGDKTKISRIFPEDESPSLYIKSGYPANLTPLSSAPLKNQKIAHEAFLILHSREPILGDLVLRNKAGNTANETMGRSVNINIFDRGLSNLDLRKIGILVLPFAVAN